MSEIKFAHVRLTFCTCANYKSDMCEFLFHGKTDPIGPRHQPKKSQGPDQFHPIEKRRKVPQKGKPKACALGTGQFWPSIEEAIDTIKDQGAGEVPRGMCLKGVFSVLERGLFDA